MSIEPCKLGPCPMIKTCGEKLPPQPYRCYNCLHKLEQKKARPMAGSRARGNTLEVGDGADLERAVTYPLAHPLPNVARQPAGCVKIQRRHSDKPFSFSCSNSSHYATPHYTSLPLFLPHQDHPCPPCQLTQLRSKGETDVLRQAKIEHPKLTEEMLIRNGCIKEWQDKPTLAAYLEERVTEERQMWHHVTRKWTQDLRKCRVLVAEEDGLGLLA